MVAKLAKHQARLNPDMPLVLMTDDRPADWASAAKRLAHGSVIVVRARDATRRRELAEELSSIATIVVADDAQLAQQVGAAGLHLPEKRMKEALHWRARHPDWIITSTAHSLKALMATAGLDAVFLSSVFATNSHPGAQPLTPARAGFIAAHGQVPVYALGGVTPGNAALLAPAFSGIAAIASLL
jgi:thiamine-phosphate pyrophosphorylase